MLTIRSRTRFTFSIEKVNRGVTIVYSEKNTPFTIILGVTNSSAVFSRRCKIKCWYDILFYVLMLM